jgi:Fe-S cluster assembly protein SufD
MSAVATKKDTSAKWLEQFEFTAPNRLGAANPTVKEKQAKAIAQFAKTGIPDKKLEDFKYTNIRLYLNDEFGVKGNFDYLKPNDLLDFLIGGHSTITVVNGRFLKELSLLQHLPKEVTVKNLFSVIKESGAVAGTEFNGTITSDVNPLTNLNTALVQDGVAITVPKGFECKEPIHILNISTGKDKTLFNPRNIIKLGEGASLTVIETFRSINLAEKAFTNLVTEMVVEKNATLNNYVLQEEDPKAYRNDVRQVTVGTAGKFNSVVVSLNGGLIRNDLNISINGENSEIHMHGLFVVKDGQHVDNHSLVEHNVPNCFSNELYKGIIGDGGTGVFNGKIYVKQDAQKTNAYQSNKNILLGDNSTINTKPQLEIYADDVKCSHGTTTGRLDEEALFYLQTRGLNEGIARKVLLGAFAKEISDTVKDEAFRTLLEERIHDHIV